MIDLKVDTQVVGETDAQAFELLRQGPVSASLILRNTGINTINYRAQEWNGTAWIDIGVLGDLTFTTLVSGQVRTFVLSSSFARVRIVANASGGSVLEFSAQRFVSRSSGGSIDF